MSVVATARVLVGRHRPQHPIPCPTAELSNQRVGRVGSPLADHQTHDHVALGVESHVVPAVPAPRVVVGTALLLFADERPLLVEPDLSGLRGKKPGRQSSLARKWLIP